jgi:Zn-dependent protease
MNENFIFLAAIQVLILLLAISIHESAHGWVAERCGDPTARSLGRISLNPLKHLDLFGSILLPIMLLIGGVPIFGWGRPAPVTSSNIQRRGRDEILVAVAGPAANLLIAVGASVALWVALRVAGDGAREAAYLTLLRDFESGANFAHFPLAFTLVQFAYINAFLAIFHLLPVPPFDGGQLMLHILPPDWALKLERVRPYGVLVVILLSFTPLLILVSVPVLIVLSLIINLG